HREGLPDAHHLHRLPPSANGNVPMRPACSRLNIVQPDQEPRARSHWTFVEFALRTSLRRSHRSTLDELTFVRARSTVLAAGTREGCPALVRTRRRAMTKRLPARPATAGLVAVACLALMVANGSAKKPAETTQYNVPKATCGPGDHPETALQGQVPAALRAAGFKGFNCNLELIGQSRGEGANWQSAEFLDKNGHRCGYHGTASPDRSLPGRQHLGVPVIDLTNPTNPTPTGYLQTTSMLDPWESLKVNERRGLLGADNGKNGA